MSNIELVVTDVDGTLVELLADEVSEKTRAAVLAAEKRGISVVPVTGRPLQMAQKVFELLGFNDLCVVDNGATIRKVLTGELVWKKWLEPDVLKAATRTVIGHSILIDYSSHYYEHEPVMGEEEAIAEAAPYVFALIKTSDGPMLEEALKAVPDIMYHTNPRSSDPTIAGLQITHREATKFHGVEALRAITKTKIENTMAVGDGNNDLPLFENAGLKVAMGNATELLKAQADYVVGTVTEEGFAEAMDRFVLD